MEGEAIIERPFGEQSKLVKWPASDPESCARFWLWGHAMIIIAAICHLPSASLVTVRHPPIGADKIIS